MHRLNVEGSVREGDDATAPKGLSSPAPDINACTAEVAGRV